MFNTLRASDRDLYVGVHNRLHTIEESLSKKRATSQANYCKNCKKRLSRNESIDEVLTVEPDDEMIYIIVNNLKKLFFW